MVLLHVKRGTESQFLFNTTVDAPVDSLIQQITAVYNGRLKVERICSEIPELAEHGVSVPPNMEGLTEEQRDELQLEDEWEEKCVPSGGSIWRKDELGRRNGHAPSQKMKEVLLRSVQEAKNLISNKLVDANVCVTMATVREAVEVLQGAVMIVFPMGLPPHDPIRKELEEGAELTGTQASLQVVSEESCQLWWAAKLLQKGRTLQEYIGRNEKTKIVIKIQKEGQGAPAREPQLTEQQHKHLMMQFHRRQEELQHLEEDTGSLGCDWPARGELKRQFQGLKDISWRPR